MPTTYTVAIDRDDDGDFAGSGEDISADVLSIHWRLGLAQAHDSIAQPGTARITVRNPHRAYSPENTPLQPGQRVRIQSDGGTTTRTHFTGHISHIEPLPGDRGRRTAVIHAVDALAQLQRSPIRLPPQVNVRAGEVIDQILDRVPLRRSILKGCWLLGRENHGELGSNTRLPGITISRSLGAGKSSLSYVGDTWAEGIPALEAIRQLCETERGRFYIDREGQAVFLDRHALLGDIGSAAVFEDDLSDAVYSYGEEVFNQVAVRLIPRRVGSAGTTLWQLDEAQPLPDTPGEVRQMLVRFHDENERPVGALAVIEPRPALDYQANTAADGNGLDVTSQVDVTLRRADFSAALLEVRNLSRLPAYLLPAMQLRGTPLYTGDPLLVEQVSHASRAFYSPRSLLFDLPLLDSVEQADSLARFELSRRKSPRGHLRQITLTNQSHPTPVLALTLFDLITLRETQTAHDSDYFIIAEAHEVDRGGSRHRVTWTMESAAANSFWVLGRDRLNQTAVLAY